MEPWMRISLLPPPVQTTKKINNVDAKRLRKTCDNIIRVLSRQLPLHREGALMSRFVYKYDKKFRNDIGYRNIKKTKSALHKYMQVNLLKDVENFTAVLPNENDDFVPTRQMLEYILSKIITFSKLMLRIYVCSKQAAVFYLNRVKRGESHWMSLMPYSLISRIWSLSAVLLQHATDWYSCLHPHLALLEPKGLQFLPSDYELPKNLDDWLDLKNLDSFGKLNWYQKKTKSIELALDEEVDSFHNILEYASQINEETMQTGIENNNFAQVLKVDVIVNDEQLQVANDVKIDYGQAISRDSFKVLNSSTPQEIKDHEPKQLESVSEINPGQTMSQVSCKMLTNFQKKISMGNESHYFGKVTGVKTLKDFLDREEMFRNDGNKQSLTKHLSFMQWHTLKTSLLKVCDSVLNNKKIHRKLYKVWKEKCLEYI